MALALASASLTFCSTMLGGLTALRWPARTDLLMAIAGGVVLAAALFDLLPEGVQRAEDLGMSVRIPIGAVLIGFLTFYVVERLVHRHGDHDDHSDRPDPVGIAGATGFVVHSFFDGLAIGLGFQINAGVGLIVTAAVIGHDFSDGLNTVAYLIAHRHPATRSRRFLLADALAPVFGALIATLAPIPDEVFPVALGVFSGFFIYAATANLLPSAQSLSPARAVPATLAGAAAMLAISLFA